MDRKMSLVPAVVAAPNSSAKDEWFPVPCAVTPGFLYVDQKVWKQSWFSSWTSGYFHIHKATWLLAINSLWSNSAFISCHPGPALPPAKCQMLVKFAFGGWISEALVLKFLRWWTLEYTDDMQSIQLRQTLLQCLDYVNQKKLKCNNMHIKILWKKSHIR